MKFLKQAAVILILAMHLAAQAQPSDLKIFLQKFETYAKTHYPKVKWTMPIAQPESSSYAMPEATREEVFMEDLQTGLRHYARLNIIYDPATGYYLPYDPEARYSVDKKAGKIYKGKAEVKVQNKRTK